MTTKPPHPGEIVYRDCIEPSGLTITEAAAALGVTRPTLSELLNGHRGVSPEMAVRLSKAFPGALGGSAESWLMKQAQYDLAQIPRGRVRVSRARRPQPG
jgi:antitoxin HigA-1